MVELENLRVSLTKNGYMKIATIVAAHPSNEMLDHVAGTHPGVTLVRSQVANILCADPATGIVPGFWDDVRRRDRATIRAFTFVAIIFAHERLIHGFVEAGHGTARGTLFRNEMSEKEYTNLQFAMAAVGLCDYSRGTDQITYDMTTVVEQLDPVGSLVGLLLRAKLLRCGWRDPELFRVAADLPLAAQCVHEQFHQVFGMSERQFTRWITGRPTQPR
jgi:hypothetical protein